MTHDHIPVIVPLLWACLHAGCLDFNTSSSTENDLTVKFLEKAITSISERPNLIQFSDWVLLHQVLNHLCQTSSGIIKPGSWIERAKDLLDNHAKKRIARFYELEKVNSKSYSLKEFGHDWAHEIL